MQSRAIQTDKPTTKASNNAKPIVIAPVVVTTTNQKEENKTANSAITNGVVAGNSATAINPKVTYYNFQGSIYQDSRANEEKTENIKTNNIIFSGPIYQQKEILTELDQSIKNLKKARLYGTDGTNYGFIFNDIFLKTQEFIK